MSDDGQTCDGQCAKGASQRLKVQEIPTRQADLGPVAAALAQVFNPAMVQAMLIVLAEMPPESRPTITVVIRQEVEQ